LQRPGRTGDCEQSDIIICHYYSEKQQQLLLITRQANHLEPFQYNSIGGRCSLYVTSWSSNTIPVDLVSDKGTYKGYRLAVFEIGANIAILA
jgi:hypothetical protein